MKRLLLLGMLVGCAGSTATAPVAIPHLVTVVNQTAWAMSVTFEQQGGFNVNLGPRDSSCFSLTLVSPQSVGLTIPHFPYVTDGNGVPAPNTTLTLPVDTTATHVRVEIDSLHYTGFPPYAAAIVGQEVSPC